MHFICSGRNSGNSKSKLLLYIFPVSLNRHWNYRNDWGHKSNIYKLSTVVISTGLQWTALGNSQLGDIGFADDIALLTDSKEDTRTIILELRNQATAPNMAVLAKYGRTRGTVSHWTPFVEKPHCSVCSAREELRTDNIIGTNYTM